MSKPYLNSFFRAGGAPFGFCCRNDLLWCQEFGASLVKEAGRAVWIGGRPQPRRGLEEGRGGYCIGWSAIPVLADKLGVCFCGSIHDMASTIFINLSVKFSSIEHSLCVQLSPRSISRTFSSAHAYYPPFNTSSHFSLAPASEPAKSFCLRVNQAALTFL